MKVFLITMMMLLSAATGTAAEKEATGAGNGQLLIQINGSWLPYEQVYLQHTRSYRGIKNLPDGKGTLESNPVFDVDFVTGLNSWLSILKNYAPQFHALLMDAGQSTRFVFVNGQIRFKTKEYPEEVVETGVQTKAALYRGGVVYVSLPVMSTIGATRKVTAKEHQGFVFIHELINVLTVPTRQEYKSRITDKTLYIDNFYKTTVCNFGGFGLDSSQHLRLGELILSIKELGWSADRFMLEVVADDGDYSTLIYSNYYRTFEFASKVIAASKKYNIRFPNEKYEELFSAFAPYYQNLVGNYEVEVKKITNKVTAQKFLVGYLAAQHFGLKLSKSTQPCDLVTFEDQFPSKDLFNAVLMINKQVSANDWKLAINNSILEINTIIDKIAKNRGTYIGNVSDLGEKLLSELHDYLSNFISESVKNVNLLDFEKMHELLLAAQGLRYGEVRHTKVLRALMEYLKFAKEGLANKSNEELLKFLADNFELPMASMLPGPNDYSVLNQSSTIEHYNIGSDTQALKYYYEVKSKLLDVERELASRYQKLGVKKPWYQVLCDAVSIGNERSVGTKRCTTSVQLNRSKTSVVYKLVVTDEAKANLKMGVTNLKIGMIIEFTVPPLKGKNNEDYIQTIKRATLKIPHPNKPGKFVNRKFPDFAVIEFMNYASFLTFDRGFALIN